MRFFVGRRRFRLGIVARGGFCSLCRRKAGCADVVAQQEVLVAPETRSGVDLVRALRLVFGAALPAVLLSDGEGEVVPPGEADLHLLARPVAPNRLRAMVNFKLSTRTISHPDL